MIFISAGITEKVTERFDEIEMEFDSTTVTEEVPSADIYMYDFFLYRNRPTRMLHSFDKYN